jgi:small ligand-binding sensory domain FIST
VGPPFTVTGAEDRYLVTLAGRPALERLQETAAGLSEDEQARLTAAPTIGVVADEHRTDPGPGDFLVTPVSGAREGDGALAVGDPVDVGRTVQFQLRDPVAADAELRALLGPEQADAALLFATLDRREAWFGAPDHDAGVLSDAFGGIPVAGADCAGVLGPIGGRNRVHTSGAGIALFRRRPVPGAPDT